MHADATEALYSTFKRRPDDITAALPSQVNGQPTTPLPYDPEGRRFRIEGYNIVHVYGWALSIGHRPSTGLSFWDIRFRGERIVYELSLQEAFAGYGGASPLQRHTMYFDSHWGFGSAYKELVHGVDCPLNAAYMDLVTTYNGGGPVLVR